jgi:hypothetical protein
VYIANGMFMMSGGEISRNTALTGGGVQVYSGTFTMSDGTISGNMATYGDGVSTSGGGVYIAIGTFEMSGGEISGNTGSPGGGVCVATGTFTKQGGGTIYGSDASDALKNTATSGNNYGHAVYVYGSPAKKRNTTAGLGVTLDSGTAGGWE